MTRGSESIFSVVRHLQFYRKGHVLNVTTAKFNHSLVKSPRSGETLIQVSG